MTALLRQGCFITSERTILEHYLYDVVFQCVLLTKVETSGWAIQSVDGNEVKFWFTQMTFYNICIPLIIRQANDVEENPTIFEVIDLTRTVCADYNQRNEVLFCENAGKQYVAMSLRGCLHEKTRTGASFTLG